MINRRDLFKAAFGGVAAGAAALVGVKVAAPLTPVSDPMRYVRHWQDSDGRTWRTESDVDEIGIHESNEYYRQQAEKFQKIVDARMIETLRDLV